MHTNIRTATLDDAADILKIYSSYITDTCISFETEVPSLSDFENRIASILLQYPYLVYESDGQIIGYAYSSKHRERAAYLYSVDVSVYVSSDYHGQGVGKKLYSVLLEMLTKRGFYTAFAGITMPNDKSIGLHKSMGFIEVGTYHNVGYKHGKWHNVMWLEKPLQDYYGEPKNIKLLHTLQSE